MTALTSESQKYTDLLRNVTDAPEWLQTQIAASLAQLEHERDPQHIAASVNHVLAAQQNLNQQSVNNEALLARGGYDATVATEVAASAGVGGSVEAAEQAAADFSRQVAQAIANGIPLDQVRFDDPTLTEAAKAAIYEQVAQQQGTSAARVEQEAKERAERDMQAVQGVVFGAVGLGLSADKGLQNLMLGANHAPEIEAVAAEKENPKNPFAALLNGTGIIENLTKSFNDTSTPEQQAQSGQSQVRDGWAR